MVNQVLWGCVVALRVERLGPPGTQARSCTFIKCRCVVFSSCGVCVWTQASWTTNNHCRRPPRSALTARAPSFAFVLVLCDRYSKARTEKEGELQRKGRRWLLCAAGAIAAYVFLTGQYIQARGCPASRFSAMFVSSPVKCVLLVARSVRMPPAVPPDHEHGAFPAD